jgi:signal peptidase I
MSSQVPEAETPSVRHNVAGRIRFLLLLALGAWILRSLIVAPFSIPSGSMLPTMAIGDYLFVAKWPYGYSRYSFPFQIPSFRGRILSSLPERGDVVIFKRPDNQAVDWVKRVIGLPGDTVAVEDGQLVINGKRVARQSEGMLGVPVSPNSPCRVAAGATPDIVRIDGEALCRYPVYRETLPGGRSYRVLDQVDAPTGDHFGPVTVPQGHLLLMGDNRDDSLDSRYSLAEGGLGMVPLDHLVGKATFAFWSTDGSASYWKPWTWFTALRSDRIGEDYRP